MALCKMAGRRIEHFKVREGAWRNEVTLVAQKHYDPMAH